MSETRERVLLDALADARDEAKTNKTMAYVFLLFWLGTLAAFFGYAR